MRGSKPFWIFTAYVLCLCFIGVWTYWTSIGREGLSLSSAQSELTGFFNSLIIMLGAAICVISPALTATAIVAERQRLSLDLVLSAPVEPKYLLVGKMISSYRYTWMLLILALPIVAMSVVLGGATWKDVFSCFLLLSFHAMIFTSMALLISTFVNKPAAAVIYSFIGVAIYVVASSMLAATALPFSFGGGASTHPPFTIALSPFFVLQAVNSSMLIGSVEVPNWLLAGVFTLLLCRLFLLGAAVNLAPLDKRISANLRLTGLLYTFGLGALIPYSIHPAMPAVVGASPELAPDPSLYVLNIGLGSICWLFLGSWMLFTYGRTGSRRFWPNGHFSLRHTLDGTPAGQLPYALLLVGSGLLGAYLGNRWVGGDAPSDSYAPGLLWPVGFVVLAWGLGHLLSAACREMKSARAFHFCAEMVIFFGIPLLMSVARTAPSWVKTDSDMPTSGLWYLWPFAPLIDRGQFWLAWAYGVVMICIGLWFKLWAVNLEGRRARELSYAG